MFLTGEPESISSKVRNEARVSTLSSHIQHNLGIPSQSNKAGKEIKGIQIGKEYHLSIFAKDMMFQT
jgi:hypothetical protein